MQTIQCKQREWTPSKVICVGRNYVAHIKELQNDMPDEIVLFIKPNSAISQELKQPSSTARFEAELCFLIQQNKMVGVGFGLDLTLVDVQNRLKQKSLPWEKAKAFDGSAVLSPFVDFSRWQDLRIELSINGELRQKGSTDLMIHSPETILQEVKQHFSLEDGDIIMTGTPKGVGKIELGDKYEGRIFEKEKLLIRTEWLVNEKHMALQSSL